jgi:hypothetical protein
MSSQPESREREIYAEIARRKQAEASVERMRRAYEKAERERQWSAPWAVPSPLVRGEE